MQKSRRAVLFLIFLMVFVLALLFSSCSAPIELTLDANGGVFKDGNGTYVLKTYGQSAVSIPVEPTKEGMVFVEWCIDRECTRSAAELLSRPVISAITLYAKWGYAITFDTNGGSALSPLRAAAGDAIQAPKASQKTGYKLAGWFKDKELTEQYEFSTMPEEHFTLYAKWELINAGLDFQLINNGTEYQVKIGTCEDEDIFLPSEYNGKSVTKIPYLGFYNHRHTLTTISISESIRDIADKPFGSDNLLSISVNKDNPVFVAFDGNLYRRNDDGSATLLIYAPSKTATVFAVPDSISYDTDLFSNLTMDVKGIGENAFYGCESLSLIVIPLGIKTIEGPLVDSYCNTVFATEAVSQPEGWALTWNNFKPVLRGCGLSNDAKRVFYFDKSESTFYIAQEDLSKANDYPFLTGGLIGDWLFEGWYTDFDYTEASRVNNLSAAPSGRVYAKWSKKSEAYVLDELWKQCKDLAGQMWGIDGTFIKNISSEILSEHNVYVLLPFSDNGYALAFEVSHRDRYKEDYQKALEYLSLTNSLPMDYINIPGTNVYVANDYSLKNIFMRDVKVSNSNYLSKDGKTLLQAYANTSFELPQKITHIGDRAFAGSRIETLVFNDKLESIGRLAFADCNFATLALPDTLLKIGHEAFGMCTRLESITIPASVTQTGNGLFRYCHALTSIEVSPDNPYFEAIDGSLYTKGGGTLVHVATGKTGEFTVPDGVTRIEDKAFITSLLTKVNIGESVLEIGSYVFFECDNINEISVAEGNPNYMSMDGNLYSKDGTVLIRYASAKEDESFVLPESVTRIEAYAFSTASTIRLKNIVLGKNVENIGANAFQSVELDSLTIPENVVTLGRVSGQTLYCEAQSKPQGWWARYDYALWNCTLAQDKSYVESITLASSLSRSLGAPFRQGYRFMGWYDNPEFAGEPREGSYLPAGTYYAKWEPETP